MKTESVKSIEVILKTAGIDETKLLIQQYESDERAGVQSLLDRFKRRIKKEEAELRRLDEMSLFEKGCLSRGEELIAGVDEVGRGPLAGPVVAAAVILPAGWAPRGINDSKKVSEKMRDKLYSQIMDNAISVSVSMISPPEIDRINIYQASKAAMVEAVEGLSVTPHHVLIDAMTIDINIAQTKIIKGDEKSISIAAASIVAKVTRDQYMKKLHEDYPQYGFAKNMGYGTAEHLQGLKEYGPTEEHRKSFAPVQAYSS
ncbi:ribonuclease HII [Fictibacillus aquaticus]|uniref:Ribonuclease HII n=1 Tax=Fictibacillus aquaticus TaxID=2021314 RepID=A0A235FCC2_9BACL|nr:ribonuclease HII [Fictibacillus aquaticus]OYD58872.1 ribonuclease HII [Fictibacillus aquaticus]